MHILGWCSPLLEWIIIWQSVEMNWVVKPAARKLGTVIFHLTVHRIISKRVVSIAPIVRYPCTLVEFPTEYSKSIKLPEAQYRMTTEIYYSTRFKSTTRHHLELVEYHESITHFLFFRLEIYWINRLKVLCYL